MPATDAPPMPPESASPTHDPQGPSAAWELSNPDTATVAVSRSGTGLGRDLRCVRACQDDVEAQQWSADVAEALFGKPADPVRIGRYTVIERLGTGGCGVVYAAYDPQLDRRIAVKLLRRDLSDEKDSNGNSRLQHEARSLARLSHPNVVSVFDVGDHEGQVFIAMEFVRGGTLKQWMATPRSLEEIVSVFAAAGRGLAAAHRAGIVHRDFKPDNVLIGDDGRVKVSDFGIAHREAAGGESTEVDRPPLCVSITGDLDLSLTPTGFVVGTPAYMAPEQYLDRRVDARTDQFGFCVAMFEALYGARPFRGDTFKTLAKSVVRGRVRPAPEDSDVPTWLHRAVVRGLSKDPDRRHPTMAGLLGELTRDRRTRHRWLTAAGFLGGLTIAGFVAIPSSADSAGICANPRAAVDRVWTSDSAARVRRAFLTSGLATADENFERVDAAIESYSDAWVEAQRTSCRDEDDNDAKIHRTACLQWRLQDLRSLIDVLAQADTPMVAHAMQAVDGLAAPASCLTVRESDAAAPKADLGQRTRIATVRAKVARAKALGDAGKPREGLELARSAASSAQALGYRPLEAEALLVLGSLQHLHSLSFDETAETTLYAALLAAESARRWDLAARTLVEITTVNVDLQRFDRAAVWAQRARGAIDRAGGDPRLEGRIHYALGLASLDAGDPAGARPKLRRAIELLEGTDHADTWIGKAHNVLGETYWVQGRYEESVAHYEIFIEAARDAFGPDHPWVANGHGNLGEARAVLGDHEQALAHFEAAYRIRAAAFGPDSRWATHTLAHIADMMAELGRDDEAIAGYERVIATWTPGDSAIDGDQAAWARNGMARLLAERGEPDRALALARLTTQAEPGSKARHLDAWGRIDMYGQVLLNMGRDDDALAQFDAVLPRMIGGFGEGSGVIAQPLTGRGLALIALGRPLEAIAPLQRALALLENDRASTRDDLGRTRFSLARALAASGTDPGRAIALAEAARADFEASRRSVAPAQRAAVAAWLAAERPDPAAEG